MSTVKKIYVLNGPNLNLLGEREPDIYGNLSLKDIEKTLIDYAKDYDVEIYFKQSNHEGELIELVQEASKKANAIIINPAGYSHTSVALLDALLASKIPVLEVHISNIFKREDFRHNSYVSKSAIGVISGLGIDGYLYSLKFLLDYLKWWSFILTKNQIKIIGVGGVSNGEDAFEKITSGATLVQLYTGMVYKGPNIVNMITNIYTINIFRLALNFIICYKVYLLFFQ